jgi:hypothetical protein
MRVIYEAHRWDILKWHDINTKFHEDCLWHSGNMKVIASTIWEAAVLVLLMARIYGVSRWGYLRWHDTYIPSFMTIGSGIWVILGVLPQQNLRGYSVVITDERDLWCTPLKWIMWHDIRTKFNADRFRHLSIITVITATIWVVVMLVLLIERIYEMCCWAGLRWHDVYRNFHED